MSLPTIAWYGKLPSHGDFLQRRVPEQFLPVWDDWLQRCIVHASEQLGSDWRWTCRVGPLWRFFLSDGLIGSATFAGVMLPSMDRVGRYFPLTIFAPLPRDLPPMAVAIHGRAWLRAIETIALGALENENLQLEMFDAELQASAELLQQVEHYYGAGLGTQFPAGADHWRVPMTSSDRVAGALIDPLMASALHALRPMSMWWTDGSEQVSASCLLSRSLPDPARVTAMWDGGWSKAGWSGDFDDFVSAAPGEASYRVQSAALMRPGTAPLEQDRCLEHSAAGLWMVAGCGPAASQVVDAIGATSPESTLGATLQNARLALARTAAKLDAAVAILGIRQQQWGVLWSGGSRAYLLRNEGVVMLTRDQSSHLAEPSSVGPLSATPGSQPLQSLNCNTGKLLAGDRFLLCSDGVHQSLVIERLREIMMMDCEPRAAVELLINGALQAGARDNITALIVDVVA